MSNRPLAAQAILGSYRRSFSSFTDIGSSHRDTHIPDHILSLIATRVFFQQTDHETSRDCWRSTISGILNQIQTIISTIVATVALAYIFPDSILLCNLDQKWQASSSRRIRTLSAQSKMSSDAAVFEVFTIGHGLSRTGITGTMHVNCS
ncbi:hypothetical protein N7488_004605 [Penicillium malachiteum]|nr:hypothetical protein N7488_004605 [Penicillium malachiteum]